MVRRVTSAGTDTPRSHDVPRAFRIRAGRPEAVDPATILWVVSSPGDHTGIRACAAAAAFPHNAAISIASGRDADLDRHAEPEPVSRRLALCGNTLNESPRHRAASLMTEG